MNEHIEIKKFDNIEDTLQYFFKSRPHGTIKLGLQRINTLLRNAGNPEKSFKSIQIAGTNGKGSVTRMLSTIFTTLGFRTGANYSPHLVQFNERITFNNEMISDDEIIKTANQLIEPVSLMDKQSEEMKPSFFECTTAMAFKYFENRRVDVATVEVGLGGRLDATTALHPEVTVITSIGLDHTKTLGDTIPLIAAEKAGIIKEETPLVCGAYKKEAVDVIQKVAEERKAKMYLINRDYSFEKVSTRINSNIFNFQSENLTIENVELKMNGTHQFQNASTAIMAYLAFCEKTGIHPDISALKNGLKNTFWPGRFEVLNEAGKTPIIIDGAHNPEGIDALMENWNIYFPAKRTVLLTGMLSGKDYSYMTSRLASISEEIVVTEPNAPRETDTQLIVEAYGKVKNASEVHYLSDHGEACEKAFELALKYDSPILITGSLYVIGYLKKIIQEKYF
ncbi:MAG TPA: folylpolyglutamate synthase/dihydrofolate synthase family protein [Thermotogota bacterium]|nr:folylpolyglutamate synthase/dihydrofolate synthase family protein [Thermotogota bacterium]HPJ87871.1 folylpolyglutamate synthase/dihydrofolate synthase family protein [Thermotogota bacterium]HPR94964.1 folylpolyglutamate synthase/dihydrofolate synthase family protein [Thermotogota bacterium]